MQNSFMNRNTETESYEVSKLNTSYTCYNKQESIMKTSLYQIFDVVSGTTVGPIIPYNRDAAAIRAFQEIATSQGTQIQQHPRDFVLLLVGTQDTDTGAITPNDKAPTVIYGGDTMLAQLAEREKDTGDSAPAANSNGAANASLPVLAQSEQQLEEEFHRRRLELREQIRRSNVQ